MNPIDNETNLNNIIVQIEAELARNQLQKELLIKETFILWYILIEGISCENFEEKQISELLTRNFNLYQTNFSSDTDFCFILGWMITIAFWYFDADFNEEYGNQLLFKTYKNSPTNSLFKWAVRDQLNLDSAGIKKLKNDIQCRFLELYDYGPFIQNYFRDVIFSSSI
jgi:hypothetical protein